MDTKYTLETLPLEILHQIFRELPQNDSKHISLTSRYFRLAVEPIHYHTVNLWTPTEIALFLRSIIHNFRIARHVKCLQLMCYKPNYMGLLDCWGTSLVMINRYIERMLSKPDDSLPSTETLRETICNQWDDQFPKVRCTPHDIQETEWSKLGPNIVCTVLILKSLVNLKWLSTKVSRPSVLLSAFGSCPGQPLMQGHCPSERLLPNLRQLTWFTPEWDNNCSETLVFLDCAFWMFHPTLKHILIHPSGRAPTRLDLPKLCPVKEFIGQAKVQTIRIQGPLRWEFVESLIKLPRSLDCFQWETGNIIYADEADKREPLSRIFKPLAQHAHSLQKLNLWFPPTLMSTPQLRYIKMLTNFSNLEELAAPLEVFLGNGLSQSLILSDYLPSSLRTLRLRKWVPPLGEKCLWDDSACLDALAVGLKNIRSKCPVIQQVICECFSSLSAFDGFCATITDTGITDILSYRYTFIRG
jgi:hypothetical protein